MKYFLTILIFALSLQAEIKYQAPTIPAEQGKLYNEIIDLRSKNPQEALKKFSNLPKDYSPAFDYLQAVILIDLKQNDRAIPLLKKSLGKMPSFYHARLNLSQILLQSKDYKAALPELMELVKLGRADGAVWKNISICHLELNKLDSAELALNQARLFNADEADLDKALLNIYLKQENFTKAEILSKQLLESDPAGKQLWDIYIHTLLANKKQHQALLNLELKIKLFGAEGADLQRLADLYYNEGIYLKAASVYLKIDRSLSGRAIVQAARCYTYSNDYTKVLNILKSPQQLSPAEKEEFYTVRAQAYLKTANSEKALNDYLEVLKFNSNNNYAQFYIAEIYEEMKQYEKALDYYSRAEKNSSFYLSSKLRKARVYMSLEQFPQALAEVEMARKVDPSSSTDEFLNYLKAKVRESKN